MENIIPRIIFGSGSFLLKVNPYAITITISTMKCIIQFRHFPACLPADSFFEFFRKVAKPGKSLLELKHLHRFPLQLISRVYILCCGRYIAVPG